MEADDSLCAARARNEMVAFDDLPSDVKRLVHEHGFARVIGLHRQNLPCAEIEEIHAAMREP